MDTEAIRGLIYVAIIITAFLLFREVVCWYWKHNEMVTLLREISGKLDKINNNTPVGEKDISASDNN